MAEHEYRWRDFMNFFRASRILIDDEAKSLKFDNCLRSKSFWNFFPLSHVACTGSDITAVKTFTQEGHRCLQVETATAKAIFLSSDVPNFDDLVARVREVTGKSSEEA